MVTSWTGVSRRVHVLHTYALVSFFAVKLVLVFLPSYRLRGRKFRVSLFFVGSYRSGSVLCRLYSRLHSFFLFRNVQSVSFLFSRQFRLGLQIFLGRTRYQLRLPIGQGRSPISARGVFRSVLSISYFCRFSIVRGASTITRLYRLQRGVKASRGNFSRTTRVLRGFFRLRAHAQIRAKVQFVRRRGKEVISRYPYRARPLLRSTKGHVRVGLFFIKRVSGFRRVVKCHNSLPKDRAMRKAMGVRVFTSFWVIVRAGRVQRVASLLFSFLQVRRNVRTVSHGNSFYQQRGSTCRPSYYYLSNSI